MDSGNIDSQSESPERFQVTKSYLPALDNYVARLEMIWRSGQLTNNGPMVQELEALLRSYLEVEQLFAVSNGTIALQIAVEALELNGDVITTPFSYVATTSSLIWQKCRPVFADIDPKTLDIDPVAIEAAITPETTGILATHIYGFPCDVDAIEAIAEKHGIKVIYDAAHCFGVRFRGRGLLSYGDIAITSFHATKIFHCAEGGALATGDPELANRISYMRNFGHKGREDFQGVGINGKLSELHAAMGLAVFEQIECLISRRREVVESYWQQLDRIEEIRLLKPASDTEWNYAYLPVIFPSEKVVEVVRDRLSVEDIFPRRYFYPPLNRLPGLKTAAVMPVAEDMASRILCLPVFPGLPERVVARVVEEIAKATSEES